MDVTVKQGQNKIYVGDDEEKPLALMTYVLMRTQSLKRMMTSMKIY